jgi:hypothetical protein
MRPDVKGTQSRQLRGSHHHVDYWGRTHAGTTSRSYRYRFGQLGPRMNIVVSQSGHDETGSRESSYAHSPIWNDTGRPTLVGLK